ncbi:MAG: hypothetical protein COA80_11930 [Leeuwenhoekiella sp.]|nr:MAG: hypothetical protein COA80_11930 [Leeuwenhoekiella sp.]
MNIKLPLKRLKFPLIVAGIFSIYSCQPEEDLSLESSEMVTQQDSAELRKGNGTRTAVYVSGFQQIIPNHFIKMTLNDGFSSLYYIAEDFNETQGGNYVLDYVDAGGTGMDAYPNITIGSSKASGTYYVSDPEAVGMPVQIQDIPATMNFVFETSQANALDAEDKWMASINFIFDSYGTADSEPDNSLRDYDLVVMHESHNFNDSIEDNPKIETTERLTYWYFARNADLSIKPYVIRYKGKDYTYAVRYKFFANQGSKDEKVHVKFIPYGPNGTPPLVRVNIKDIVAASKSYYQYANLPQAERDLADAKVAKPEAWIKSINLGYEVYKGDSQLRIDKFKVNL